MKFFRIFSIYVFIFFGIGFAAASDSKKKDDGFFLIEKNKESYCLKNKVKEASEAWSKKNTEDCTFDHYCLAYFPPNDCSQLFFYCFAINFEKQYYEYYSPSSGRYGVVIRNREVLIADHMFSADSVTDIQWTKDSLLLGHYPGGYRKNGEILRSYTYFKKNQEVLSKYGWVGTHLSADNGAKRYVMTHANSIYRSDYFIMQGSAVLRKYKGNKPLCEIKKKIRQVK